ncbi:4,5-dioxygenase [Vibrio sinensis]|uniref:4,5-dioxygenase n=1 Tax=Vibrio sinensis TaxID=2302434 RepID=A0A3A6QMT6_9VIBR|nr:DOPA 4,5-dioxygenase family protein [Vibrio sinensis]RJX68385.1 4,5-dioxygenase [Vibrio sinensis]
MTYPVNNYQEYHAHIYFDAESQDYAFSLREQVAEKFQLAVGSFNTKLVGPHLMWSFSITFSHQEFDALIEWLESVRKQHSVLVHALTGDDLRDHTDLAYWLGDPVPLKISLFE